MYRRIKKFKELKDDTNSESEDKQSTRSGGKGFGSNNLSMFKVMLFLFKTAGVMAVALVIIGFVVSLVEFFSVTTGTVVQITDGSIISYGEPTPGPDADKKNKNGKSNVAYNGDELYIKCKMIVEACMNNPENVKKVNNISVPNGTPKLLKTQAAPPANKIYNFIEAEYIMRELGHNDFMKSLSVADWKVPGVRSVDAILWGSCIQENSVASGYVQAGWENPNKSSFMYAHKVNYQSNRTLGPFQMEAGYFAPENHIVFVTSLENPSAGEYGKAGFLKNFDKNLLKINKDKRLQNANGGHPSGLDYFQFSDICPSVFYVHRNELGPRTYTKNFLKIMKTAEIEINENNSFVFLGYYGLSSQRGPSFGMWSVKADSSGKPTTSGASNAKIITSSMGTFTPGKILVEMYMSGYADYDALEAVCPKVDTKNYETWHKELGKTIIKKLQESNKSGICGNLVSDWENIANDNITGSTRGKERPMTPLWETMMGVRAVKEVSVYADVAFDKLGLVLPDSGGEGTSLQLKETPGKFQAFWSDKNGKTLTSEQMKSYTPYSSSYKQNYLKYIGTKEDGGSMNGKLNPDKFAKKFGENIGFIQYHQGGISPPGVWESKERPYKNNHSHDAKYCWTYSCGMYVTSEALSTLLHRYVHPFEIAYAQGTYNDRHGTNHESPYIEHKYSYEAQARLISEQRYKNKEMFNVESSDKLEQSKVDTCLSKDGLITVALHAKVTNGGHFIIIREKSNGKYYLGISNASDSNTAYLGGNRPWTWSELTGRGMNPNQVNYITPAEGYKQYIKDNSSSGSSGGSGNGVAGKFTNLGNGWYGYLGTDQYYPYWTQNSPQQSKPRTPQSYNAFHYKSGCAIYSLAKVACFLGASPAEPKILLHEVADKIGARPCKHAKTCTSEEAHAFTDIEGIKKVVPGKIESVERKGKYGRGNEQYKWNLRTPSGMETCAKWCLDRMKEGKIIIMQVDHGSSHFVVVCASNGKKIKIWDSGYSGATNTDTWISNSAYSTCRVVGMTQIKMK